MADDVWDPHVDEEGQNDHWQPPEDVDDHAGDGLGHLVLHNPQNPEDQPKDHGADDPDNRQFNGHPETPQQGFSVGLQQAEDRPIGGSTLGGLAALGVLVDDLLHPAGLLHPSDPGIDLLLHCQILALLETDGHRLGIDWLLGDHLQRHPGLDPVLEDRTIIEGGGGVTDLDVVPHRVGRIEVLDLVAVLLLVLL